MAVRSRARDFDWCGSTKLPPLGLSSVRFIVNKYETDHRITAQQCVKAIDVNCAGDSDVVEFTGNVSVEEISDDEFGILVRDIPIWRRALWCFAIAFSRRIPSVSIGNFGAVAVATSLLAPRMITYFLVYPFCRLVFGTLYPAYASYKAVRTKNLKEYVKWMMYWIVFALFTCAETVTDVFLSWFPFYYEVKIVLVLWLLSPATKGSSILYRKFVHPALCRREQEIDEYISKAKEQGYHTVLNLGSKGVNYATTVIMQTAIKNLNLATTEKERNVRAVTRGLRSRDEVDGGPVKIEQSLAFAADALEYPLQTDRKLYDVNEDVTDDEIYEIEDNDEADATYTAARTKGCIVRKRKGAKKGKAGGRKTRSQTAAFETEGNEVYVD